MKFTPQEHLVCWALTLLTASQESQLLLEKEKKRNESDLKLAFGSCSNYVIAACCLCTNVKWKLALLDPILSSQMKKLNRNIFCRISNQDGESA